MEEWMTVRTRQPVKTGQLVGLSFGSKTIPFVSRFSNISISPIRSVKFDNIPLDEESIDIPVTCLQIVVSPSSPLVLQN